jgi:prepilin-type processing-associated H-X9-DG protein
MGLAAMQYAQDYDETLPPAYQLNGGPFPDGVDPFGSGHWLWWQMLHPYHKSTQIFVCPSLPNSGLAYHQGRYGCNFLFITHPSTRTALASIQSVATTYMFMDAGNYQIQPYFIVNAGGGNEYLPGMGDVGGTCGATAGIQQNDCQSGRHFGGNNVTFADGHVKWLKASVMRQEAIEYGTTNPPTSSWDPLAN